MTGKTDELDSFMDEDESSEQASSEETPTEETETKEEPKGESEEKSEEKSEDTTEDKSEPPSQDSDSVPKPALLDERRKRQEAEKQLEELRALVPKQDTEPDMYEDAEAWKEWHKNKLLEEQRTEQETLLRKKLETSRSQLLENQTDYNQMEVVFEVLAQRDQTLASKMLASEDPAQFAYDTAKDKGKALFAELFGQPVDAEKVIKEAEKAEDQTESVDLTNASSQESNTPKALKDNANDYDEVFEDQRY